MCEGGEEGACVLGGVEEGSVCVRGERRGPVYWEGWRKAVCVLGEGRRGPTLTSHLVCVVCPVSLIPPTEESCELGIPVQVMDCSK